MEGHMVFETIHLELQENGVVVVSLNRPGRSNALSMKTFEELGKAFELIAANGDIYVVVLKANGKHFCSGIDLDALSSFQDNSVGVVCEGRVREELRKSILQMQKSISAAEICFKPVIAAIHGACIGGGIDLITACDIRYCTNDAIFSVKEVDLAITADLGTLQRLPKIVGHGVAMELSLTARNFNGKDAEQLKLVSKSFETPEEMFKSVMKVAKALSQKSPLALLGTKKVLLHARDHSVADGLDFVSIWNSAMLISSDLREVQTARERKGKPSLSKL